MKHLKENNETYWSHFKFASGLGLKLLQRGIFFVIHGIFPFLPVPKKYNIDSTQNLVNKAKKYSDNRK